MSALRNASAKFSLANLGRKVSDSPNSPGRWNNNNDSDLSPPRGADTSGGSLGPNGPGGGPAEKGGIALDAFGKKLGKSIAHQSLLPGLGNQDLRALQE